MSRARGVEMSEGRGDHRVMTHARGRPSVARRGAALAMTAAALVSAACGPRQRPAVLTNLDVPTKDGRPPGAGTGTATARPHAGLSDVSCPTNTWCLAAGAYRDGSRHRVLVTTWDGARWSLAPDVPTGDAAEVNDISVDCAGPAECVATVNVERSDTNPGTDVLLASWDGSAWAVVPRALAPGVDGLGVVSCGGPGSCLAVGTEWASDGAQNATQEWVEAWDGTRWHPVAEPGLNPALGRRVRSLSSANLSCDTPTACTRMVDSVTGDVEADDPVTHHVLQQWNGTSWTSTEIPKPPQYGFVLLTTIDCVAANACIDIAVTEKGLAVMQWDGIRWAVGRPTSSSSPWAGIAHPMPVIATGLACATRTRCVSLADLASTDYGTLSAFLDLAWTPAGVRITTVSLPAQSDGSKAVVTGTTCHGDGMCMLVGYATTPESDMRPLAFQYRF